MINTNNHTPAVTREYGNISLIAPNRLIGLSSSLYISRKDRYITKYAINGVIPYETHDAPLNANSANSALKPAFINTGTITPLSIDHALTAEGTNIVVNITRTNVVTIRGMPVNLIVEIRSATNAVKTFPMFVSLNIEINVEAKNINTSGFPIPSNEWPR